MKHVASFLCLVSLYVSAISAAHGSYVKFSIEHVGFSKLSQLKQEVVNDWWIEVGTKFLMRADENSVVQLRETYAVDPEIVSSASDSVADIIIMWHVHNNTWSESWNLDVLVSSSGFSVVLPRDLKTQNSILETVANSRIFHQKQNLQLAVLDTNSPPMENDIVFLQSANAVPVRTLVNAVDVNNWKASVEQLATYNRFTRGTGIAAAQTWITNKLKANTGMTVTTEQFPVTTTTAYNVIGKLIGTDRPNDWIIVGAHYDSTSQSTSTAAPGAEDNASGTAAVLEMARIMSLNPPPVTVIFILFSGEEQGLYGSKFNAANIVKNGDKSKVKLAHTMDMIAFKLAANTKKVLIETSSTYSSWFTTYRNAAATFTPNLGVVTSTNPFGSDHVSYINEGMPGILTIDNDYDSYPHYHRTTDLPQYLTPDLAYDIIRMNIAVVGTVAGYPA